MGAGEVSSSEEEEEGEEGGGVDAEGSFSSEERERDQPKSSWTASLCV